jgi:transcriptional regulator with XRE-family HTH domain
MDQEHDCLATQQEFLATADRPFHFTDSGLPNVYLVGITYFQCSCGHSMAEIPAIKQLLELIAKNLIEKPEALTGDEVRFLRKRLGKKAKDFAVEVGIEPETLSRIENGHLPVAQQTDKLIRADYLLSTDSPLVEQMRKALLEVLKSWKQAQQPSGKIVAKVTNNEWASERAA